MKVQPRRRHQRIKRRQIVQLHRKAALRRMLLPYAVAGAVYVPFIGTGDLARMYVPTRQVFGADLNGANVARARAKLPHSLVVTADCSGWPFRDTEALFSICDFDACPKPYQTFAAFWGSAARRADPLAIFFTDSYRARISQTHCLQYPDGREEILPGHKTMPDTEPDRRLEARLQQSYWREVVLPWVELLIAPWQIVARQIYYRESMIYWGAMLSC